jgi:hypothetical protein
LKADETYELARGGQDGGPNVTTANGVDYGDGGSGQSGIVIIRFPR